MENRNHHPWRDGVRFFAAACAVYFLLDFPIRFTGAYSFPACVGIKSFLPFTLGIACGPSAVAGAALGAVCTGLVCGTGAAECLMEVLCILLAGLGSWLCWFGLHRSGQIRLERFRDVGIYAAIVLGLSALCGGIVEILIGRSAILPVAGILAVTGLLVGLPVSILLGGIFCVTPVLPWFCREEGFISFELTSRDAGPGAVNEAIEADALDKKIPMKRVFEIENCLEELYIRIRKKLPQACICGRVALDSTISMRLWVDGEKYNPFLREADEDEVDLLSLKLLRHRALRASWSFTGGKNLIRVVV